MRREGSSKGLLRRIQPAGSPGRYGARVADHHHHLVCRTGDRMVAVDCARGDTQKEPAEGEQRRG